MMIERGMASMERLKVGVIGVGVMGVNHVRNYAEESSHFDLVGVYDNAAEHAKAVAEQFHTVAFDNIDALLDAVDAVSVVVPSSLHKEIGLQVAAHGVHALIEKPLALNSADAELLTQAFDSKGLKLQVGHIERFNPVVIELEKLVDPNKTFFVETHRYGPYSGNGRITDASVVEDLMIHDVDLVCHLMAPLGITGLSANGESLYSGNIDFASTMLKFGEHAHAVVSVSRVSQSKERSITIHTEDNCINADLLLKTLTITKNTDMIDDGLNHSTYRQDGVVQRIFVPICEPLRQELLAFYDVVVNDAVCKASGRVGTEAVRLCENIVKHIRAKATA